jgi:hypothetical protein
LEDGLCERSGNLIYSNCTYKITSIYLHVGQHITPVFLDNRKLASPTQKFKKENFELNLILL